MPVFFFGSYFLILTFIFHFIIFHSFLIYFYLVYLCIVFVVPQSTNALLTSITDTLLQWIGHPSQMPAQLFEGVAGDSVVGLEEIYNLAAYGIGRRYIPFTKYPDMLELCVLGHYCRRSIKVWTNQGVFEGVRFWR